MSAAVPLAGGPVVARPVPPWSSSGFLRTSTATTRREPDAVGGGGLCGPSSTGAARVAGRCDDARADRVLPPGARPTPAAARPPARRLGDGGFGIGPAGAPRGGPRPPVVGSGPRGLRLGRGLGLAWRLRQGTRGHDAPAPCLRRAASLVVCDLARSAHAWARPAAGRFRCGAPRLLHHQRAWGLWLPPRCECLASSPGAWDAGHSAQALRQTHPEGAAPRRLTICHHPPDPLQAPGPPCLARPRRGHPLPPVTIPDAEAQGEASLPAHPQTEQHRLASGTAGWARPRRGSGGFWGGRRFVLRGPRERHGRGVLRQPWGWHGLHLQGLERPRTTHVGAMRRQEGIAAVPHPVLLEGGTGSPRLQPREPAALFQPLPHLSAGLLASQHGEHQRCAPTPPRAPRRRMGRDEAIKHGGTLQAP
jgi:hypothetical protein